MALSKITKTGDFDVSSSDPTITFVDGSGSASISGDGGHITYDSWTANRDHIFTGAGNERFRVLGDGGVTFNGDTAAANTLDDYEEGTWTPVANRATTGFTTAATYSSQIGKYVKIGNMVVATFNLRFSNNPSGGSGSPVVTGFPFSIKSTTLPGVAMGLHTAITNATNAYADDNERIVFGSGAYTSDPNNDYLTGTVVYQTD